MQEVDISPPIKTGWFQGSKYSVKDIFLDHNNWARFCHFHPDEIRDVEREEVEKMLRCKEDGRNVFVYYCEKCNETHVLAYGCNSRLCSNCGKNYTDKWAESVSKSMFNVPHRHIIMSIPDKLWSIIREHRYLEKVLMDAAISAINDTLSYVLRRKILAGVIVVLHPFGRDLEYKPHIHVLMTEGGFDKQGNFVHKWFIPARAMRKTWQYQVLTRFKKALPKTPEVSELINSLFKMYDGFYVYLSKETRIRSKREVSRYVGRYIRHPAIANSRICGYDGKNVIFWYRDNQDVKHYKTMTVDDFIRAIIQHIPDRQFKMIRYYGAYCRKWKRKYKKYLVQVSITQTKLEEYPKKREVRCPKCGSVMSFVMCIKGKPPPDIEFGRIIDDWCYVGVS